MLASLPEPGGGEDREGDGQVETNKNIPHRFHSETVAVVLYHSTFFRDIGKSIMGLCVHVHVLMLY